MFLIIPFKLQLGLLNSKLVLESAKFSEF